MTPTTQLAFLIGVQDYQHLQPLMTPLNDIRDLGQLLQSGYGYTVQDCQNLTLCDLRAFLRQMKTKVQEVAMQLSESEPLSVLFYFAGHGIAADSETGVKGFLIPMDARRDDAKTWVPMSELLDALDELPCRHTLVLLDCCFSGSLRWASKHRYISGFASSEEKLYKQHYEHFRSRRSSQVLTSAAPDQLALDFVRGGTDTVRSPFAECVIRGLQGEADTVPDKVITCAELFAYLQNHLLAVSEKCGNPQNASLFPLDQHDFGEYLFFMDDFNPAALELREYHNPYRGLSAYETKHQSEFFGRSQAIAALLSEVEQHPLTVVLGASGTGKSSLVKAGIVPRLPSGKEGKIPIIKPGLTPLAELPDSASYKILVIDQLEQLVTQATEQDAKAFLERMAGLLASGKKIIATLRIDYESRLPKIPILEAHWHRYLVPPFSAEELREVIVTPTFRQGHFIVPMTLVDRIIEEVIHYPGSLPLLSFTMRQLFERCKDKPFGNITPADYEALGGVIGALQRKADAVHDDLPDDAHRNTMRCLMLRMVSLTGGQAASKRVLLDDLHFADPAENGRLEKVKTLLEDERLIVAVTDHSGQGYIEPVHDALVNTWDKVQQWVKSLGDANLLLHNELEAGVGKYRREGKRTSHLWHNSPSLPQTKAVEEQLLLNEQEGAFLVKSRQKRRRNTVRTWVIVAAVMAGLGGLAWFGFEQAGRAEKSAQEANTEKNNALKSQGLAESEKLNAENQQRIAEDERDNARTAEEQAVFQKEKAEKEARAASNISLALRTIEPNPTLALRIAEYTMKKHPENAAAYSVFHDILSDTTQTLYQQVLRRSKVDNYIFAVAYSPNGNIVLTGNYDKTAKLWSKEGSLLHNYEGHLGTVIAVAFSPDGKSILTGSGDMTAKLWAIDGKLLHSFEAHKGKVNSVAFSPDGKTILTGSSDKTAILWAIEGKQLQILEGHTDVVNSVAFSPDGKVALTASDDKTAKLWSLEGTLINTLNGHQFAVNSAVFSPDGKIILTGSSDWTAKCWALDGKTITTLEGHHDDVTSVAFAPDGNTIITGSRDWKAKLWNLDGKVKGTLTGHHSSVEEVAFSPDGQTILTGSVDGTARLWPLNKNLLLTLEEHRSGINAVAFSPDGKTILTGSNDKSAKLWSLNGKVLTTFEGHQSAVLAAAFSSNGKMIITGSKDKTAKIWTLDGKPIATISKHDDAVNTVAFSPDGKAVLTGSSDKTIKLSTIEGALINTLKGSTGRVNSVAFSPNGKNILSTASRTATLWSLDGKVISILEGHDNVVTCAAFSPDGKTIITGSADETVILWSLNGIPISSFVCDIAAVNSVVFSPDGKTILTGGYDNKAKLWTLEGKLISTFDGHQQYINSVSFSPDGNKILTGSSDKTAMLWMAPQFFLQERVYKFMLESLWRRGVQLEPEDLAAIKEKEKKRQ